ncbi:MAG: alkene reductase [Balneolaceae bacterium]
MNKTLFDSLSIGPVALKNRLAMAPMTRNRADNSDEAPTGLHATYYSQRAGAGIVLSEGAPISPTARGYIFTAGLYNDAQVSGWANVLNAVHEKGGIMQAQLWHTGRVSHPYFHNGSKPPAPSAIQPEAQAFTPDGFQPAPQPRELSVDEIASIVDDFRQAARNAKQAGFDGCQIHGANGYLIEQFLHDSANTRTDEYGGSIENRSRFLFEIIEAVAGEIGEERTSLRLSPSNLFNIQNDSDPKSLYSYIVERLNGYNLSFLEMVEPLADISAHPQLIPNVAEFFRPKYNGVFMTNGGYTKESATEVVENGFADLVSFGKLYLANPDLAERFRLDAPLNEPNSETFYQPGADGYTDYPVLEEKTSTAVS